MKRLLLVLLAMLLCMGAVACTPQEQEKPTPDTFLGRNGIRRKSRWERRPFRN